MTGNCDKTCQKSDVVLNIKAKRPRRFKAGAELSSAVNLVDVNVDHQIGEDFEALEINIRLNTETCVPTLEID